jgi:hypothetical protein
MVNWFNEDNIGPKAYELALERVQCCPHWINYQESRRIRNKPARFLFWNFFCCCFIAVTNGMFHLRMWRHWSLKRIHLLCGWENQMVTLLASFMLAKWFETGVMLIWLNHLVWGGQSTASHTNKLGPLRVLTTWTCVYSATGNPVYCSLTPQHHKKRETPSEAGTSLPAPLW